MSWASLLKAGGKAAKWVGRGAKTVLETGGKAVLHPQQTLRGAGAALKTAAVGGGVGYVGWKKLTTDESVVGIVSDAVIGKRTTRRVGNAVQETMDDIRGLKDSVSGMSERVSSAAENVDGKLNGMSRFLSDVSSGNGGEMLGGFLGNLAHGNVSGLGVMGLVLSAFLIFGRFGWLAKLAGAVLAMMTIGNNSRRALPPAAVPAEAVLAAETIREEPIRDAEQIHRRR